MSELLTVPAAAERVGCSRSLLWKKCKNGSLPSIRVGNEYRIAADDLAAWVKHAPPRLTDPLSPGNEVGSDLSSFVDAWFGYLTSVRALAPTTIELYRSILRSYLKRMASLRDESLTIEILFDRKTVLTVFGKTPVRSFSTRQNTHIVLMSFGRFLVEEGRVTRSVIDELRLLKPRRQCEPRRTHLKPDDVQRLFDGILTRPTKIGDNVTFAAIVGCMVFGGLRVSEVCNLRPNDVDLEARLINVRHGKGGKDRRVGISNALIGYLTAYQAIRPRGPAYFLQADGGTFDRNKVGKRLKLLARRLGIDITPHGLRRTFATLASSQGRSIDYLRIALGHANLETTQAYLRTSETEVIEAMKRW